MTFSEEREPARTEFDLRQIELTKFDQSAPESDGINLQCVNSSDFVVGKQTTFNGPVTIINYAEGCREDVNDKLKLPKEEIIIREKIFTPATVSEIKTFAEKKSEDPSPVDQPKQKGFEIVKSSFLTKKALKIPIIVWALLVIVVIVGTTAFFVGNIDDDDIPSVSDPEPLMIPYNGKKYKFVPRKSWNARTPIQPLEMKLPVPYVVISHTAGRFCYDEADCKNIIRDIQGDHMNRSPPMSDIAYNFMVGGDGNIYEGRGWKTRSASVGFVNGKNININFIGSFENFDPPTYPQTEAAKALIEYGVNNSYIDPNYQLIAANTTYRTLSPGIQVYREIMTWPHFEADPVSKLKEKGLARE